jgi:alkanesulfonate monooxygenase SsuD/methylene tetrahydromethanopterin reductase-like flavin-dependent oxidoreductase (luciferase family)
MDIGMTLPVMEPGLNRELLLDWIQRIERGPYASLAFGERIAFTNPEVMTLMGACAALTQRVRLVTTVVVLPMHDPVMLAKQAATIDMLSDGRLTLGVGIGGREEDYRSIGADLGRRANASLGDLVRTLRRVWAGEKVVDGVLRPIEPAPVQPGGPPVLAGAMGPRALHLAARWADGVCGFSWGPSLDEIAGSLELARAEWKQAGRPEPRLCTGFWYALGEDARAQLQTHLRRYLNWLDPREVEASLPSSGFAGSPAELRDFLRRIEDLGAHEVMLVPTTADPDEVDRVAQAIA